MKDFNSQKIVEIKNECENIMVVFGHTVHHLSKSDIQKAIQQLANHQVELCNIMLERFTNEGK